MGRDGVGRDGVGRDASDGLDFLHFSFLASPLGLIRPFSHNSSCSLYSKSAGIPTECYHIALVAQNCT